MRNALSTLILYHQTNIYWRQGKWPQAKATVCWIFFLQLQIHSIPNTNKTHPLKVNGNSQRWHLIHKLSVRKYVTVGTKTVLREAEQQNLLWTLGLFLSWIPPAHPPPQHSHLCVFPAESKSLRSGPAYQEQWCKRKRTQNCRILPYTPNSYLFLEKAGSDEDKSSSKPSKHSADTSGLCFTTFRSHWV